MWVLDRFPDLLGRIADFALLYAPREVLPRLIKTGLSQPEGIRGRDRLKAVEKWISAVALKAETVTRRALLLDALLAMEAEVRDTPTLLAALVHIFSLRFEWVSQPPGDRHTMTLQTGPVSLDAVPGIAALWPKALPLLTNLSINQIGSLEAILRDWVFPGSRLASKPAEGYIDLCKGFGRNMLSDLIRVYVGRWALLRRFDHMTAALGITLPQSGDVLAEVLFPAAASPFEIEHRPEHRAAALTLAHRWLDEGANPRIVADWLACEREARDHGVRHGNLSGVIAEEIAAKAADVRPWFREMWAQRAPLPLLWPVAWQACKLDPALLIAFATEMREDADYGRLVTQCLLRFLQPGAAIWEDSRSIFPANASYIGGAVLRNQLEDSTILWFLQNGGPLVTREVATSLWSADPKGQIPESLEAAWRAAVVADLEDDYQWEEIARLHPDLACAWLKRRMNQTYEERHSADHDYTFNHYLPHIIASLNKGQRQELIDHFAENNWDSSLLVSLVGDDLDLLRHALARPATARLARECLGSPEDSQKGWAERAIVLLDLGLTVEEVWQASGRASIGGEGNLSDHYEKHRLGYAAFANHADPRVREVCALAEVNLAEARDHERKRERRAAVRGELY